MDGVLAGFVDVTPFLRQSATVENLINSERRGNRKHIHANGAHNIIIIK